ncbi:MAG: Gfo/Idh/MocA family oxidoreductase, partial [bacterium]|nr:Gfo/Idh/MocA family oxidoreductase [bacterium]
RVRFAHGGPYPGWAKDAKSFYDPKIAIGGAMFDMGIHAIDLALWLFGPAVGVMAKTCTMVKKIALDDNAVIVVEFKTGALGYIEVGWTSKPGFTGVEIYGTKGSLICDYINGLKLCGGTASAGKDSVSEWTMLDKKPTRGGWDTEIGHWLDIVAGKERLEMDGKAGRAALEVALTAYQSSNKGKWISLT